MGARTRLDVLLCERGLFETRTRAAAAVLAGEVRVGTGGGRTAKPGQLVRSDVELTVDEVPRFVSRGGIKLANALASSGLDVAGRRCLDVGASTGGFTDCLLGAGAEHVVALDVAYGELSWRLRGDPRVTVIERANARHLIPAALPYAPEVIVVDVSFISLRTVLPAVLGTAAARFDALALVKPQFEVGRVLLGRGGVVRDAALRRRAMLDVATAALALGVSVRGFHPSRLPGPKGNKETFIALAESARGSVDDLTAHAMEAAWSPAVSVEVIRVMTHGRPDETRGALLELAGLAVAHGTVLALDREESAKHPLERPIEGVACDVPADMPARLCVTLGGDGTILRALRTYARTGVPVFGVNFGQVGFLATVEPERMREGFERALAGELDVLRLPAVELDAAAGRHTALNDVALHRRVGGRVAEVSYAVGGELVGSVRCDGLVVATPAGSTGYNLANGGPVMAWGAAGMVVSFIAPHSLSARALVISPDDVLTIHNSSRESLALVVDGRPIGEIAPEEVVRVHYADGVGALMQMEGSSFYRRLREKFGALSR